MTDLIDAAINGQGPYVGKAFFFHRDQYARYDWEREGVDDGFPMSLAAWNLPGDFRFGLDAALGGTGRYAGKAYFFRGGQYVRYDWQTGRVDAGYPRDLSAWGLPREFLSGIDAAVNGCGAYAGKAYFFKERSYVRYDWQTEQVDAPGIQPISTWRLPSPHSLRVDAALEGMGRHAGTTCFFRQTVCSRYNWSTSACDAGYPAHIDLWKLPDALLYPTSRARDHIWYVTIDDFDYFQSGNMAHAANLAGLQAAIEPMGIQADPIWMGNLRDEFLTEGALLALFGAGSFPEWLGAASNAEWSRQLDRYCRQIRDTRVPILAVCGTHQLVGRAFADWSAVGHMVLSGEQVPTLAAELADNTSLIPRPRLGEVGVFPLRIVDGQEADPILAGLSSAPSFVESHYDQIIGGRHPAFTAILEPNPDRSPAFGRPNTADHQNPPTPSDRCAVQLLRLNAPDRVLYTSQFHPELGVGNADPDVDAVSARYIRNFLALAAAFWRSWVSSLTKREVDAMRLRSS